MDRIDAAQAGREDATDAYNGWDGSDPDGCFSASLRDERVRQYVEQARASRVQLPDESLINAMGRDWVERAAGIPEGDDDAWSEGGTAWCEAYNTAYLDQLETLAR